MNAQSQKAHKRVTRYSDQNFILSYLQEHGTATSKEIARALNKGLNCISGRFSELRDEWNMIEPTGEEREGCAVYRIKNNELSLIF
jgi:hypothetical protein